VTFSTKKIAIVCLAMTAFAVAQAPPPAQPKPFKDDKEQALAVAASTEKDPKAQIEKLDKWKNDYPETAYEVERLNLYFQAYGATKQFHEQIGVAQKLLKNFPDSLTALRSILVAFSQITAPTAEDRQAATDAAHNIIDGQEKVFDPGKAKENGFTDAQWKDLKPQMVAYAKVQLDKMVTDQGQDAVIAALKADPTRVTLNVWLGAEILKQAQKGHPEMQADAIFHYARAAAYTGPGCLDPKDRTGMKTFVDKAYKTFHGSLEGEDKLLAVAATQALPDGYHIKSTVEIVLENNKADEEKRSANPMLASWRDLKAILTADGGQAKFDADIKDSALPKFTGKIISMTPANRPKTVVVAVETPGVADCTLTFEAALAGKMEPGEEITFEGIAKSFTKEPYMLTVVVEKDKLTGWTGKNAPAARPPAKTAKKPGN
jgi:tetratricopeptide (TPR) repeat protein